MASIRRTLSPAHHQNGAVNSPSHRAFLSYNAVKSTKRRAFLGRRSLYRCLLFFVLGFFLGLSHFGHVYPSQTENPKEVVSFMEINPLHVDATRDDFDLTAASLGETSGSWGGSPPQLPPPDIRKQLIVVTPTYPRVLQGYFLSRLGQLLRLVDPPLLWVVVEGGEGATEETAEVLRRTGLMYRHLATGRKAGEENVKDRGVHQRNAALEHIERHRLDGIVYFADDDNVYSVELFERLREIRRFGTWPVAMLAQSKNKAILEGPVCNGSQVIGWHTNEKSKRLRRFHVDMSGFAFNSTILWDPKRWARPFSNPIRQLDTVKEGFQETTFIEQVVEDESQMEGVPSGCSRILNWHLHLDSHDLVYPKGWHLQNNLDVVLPIE